jgi:hypothetical protein
MNKLKGMALVRQFKKRVEDELDKTYISACSGFKQIMDREIDQMQAEAEAEAAFGKINDFGEMPAPTPEEYLKRRLG